MRWRNREPEIWIGPAPRRRRRRRWIAFGLIVALISAIILVPGRPKVVWEPEEACAEHVVCTVSNWWGNWVGLGKLFVELKQIFEGVRDLRDLIARKWAEFLEYRRRVDYALSILRDPEEALRDYLLSEGRVTLDDLFAREEARLRTGLDRKTAAIAAALGIDSTKVRKSDWIDLATEAAQHSREIAQAILKRAQAPEPVKEGGRKTVRKNEQAIQLQLPPPPSQEEVATALKAANPATGAEAAQKVARAVAARRWASARMREAVLDLTLADRKLRKWLKELPQIYQEIDRHPYTSGIKTLTKVTIQNQIILLRILRQVSAQNLAFQARYAQIQADRASKAVREAQAEAVR